MGRCIVKSHAAGADLPYYNVELQYELGTLEAQIIELGKRLDKLNSDTIPEAEEAVEAKQSALDAKRIELHEAAQAAKQTQPLDLSEWRAIANEIAKLAGELEGERAKLIAYKSQYLAVLKERDFLQAQMSRWKDPQAKIWCVDYSPDIESGECATIEIDGEPGQVLIAPGGRAHTGQDGNLTPVVAQNWAQWFLNTASLPGWQRWRPTYRRATITDIDYEADTATVCLPVARSSQQNLLINPDDGEACTAGDVTPSGYTSFCGRNPGHAMCGDHGNGSTTYTPDLYDTLAEINQRVNDNHPYAPDTTTAGQTEFWQIAQPGEGADCEDYALEKAQELIEAGIPASAIRLAGGYTGGQGHIWVEVLTDEGSWALDNNYSEPVPADDLPWSARIYSGGEGGTWAQEGHQLSEIPVEYLTCHANAFLPGDDVIIELVGQSWDTPKVIGFESNPRACDILRLKLRIGETILTPNHISQYAPGGNPFIVWSEDQEVVAQEDYVLSLGGDMPRSVPGVAIGWDPATQDFLINAAGAFGSQVPYYIAYRHIGDIYDIDYMHGMIGRTYTQPLVSTNPWSRNIIERKYSDDYSYFMCPEGLSPYFNRDRDIFAPDMLVVGGQRLNVNAPINREWSSNNEFLCYCWSYVGGDGVLRNGASVLEQNNTVTHLLDFDDDTRTTALKYIRSSLYADWADYQYAENVPSQYESVSYPIMHNGLFRNINGIWFTSPMFFFPSNTRNIVRNVSFGENDALSYSLNEAQSIPYSYGTFWNYEGFEYGWIHKFASFGTFGEIHYESSEFGFNEILQWYGNWWDTWYSSQFNTISRSADDGGVARIAVSGRDYLIPPCVYPHPSSSDCADNGPPPGGSSVMGTFSGHYNYFKVNLNGEEI